jgi:hypothetical protein
MRYAALPNSAGRKGTGNREPNQKNREP